MINSIHSKILCVTVLACSASVFGQTDNGIVRLDLKSRPTSSNKLPDTLSVYAEIATVQLDVAQGIVFTLSIENNSTETVRILDPIDATNIHLYGLTRRSIESLRDVRRYSSQCFVKTSTPEQIKAIFADMKANRTFQGFDTYEARRNRRIKTVSDIVPWEPPPHRTGKAPRVAKPLSQSELFDAKVGGKLTLEPGQRFQAVFQGTRVYSDYKAYKKTYDLWLSDYCIPNDQGFCVPAEGAPPRPEPEIIPIPSGKYSLSIWIALYADNSDTYASASVDSVTIQLGQPTNSKQKDANRP